MNRNPNQFTSPFDRKTEIKTNFNTLHIGVAQELAAEITGAEDPSSDQLTAKIMGRLKALANLISGSRNSSGYGPYLFETPDVQRQTILSAQSMIERIEETFTIETPVKALLAGAFGLPVSDSLELQEIMNKETVLVHLLARFGKFIKEGQPTELVSHLSLSETQISRLDEMADQLSRLRPLVYRKLTN